MKILIFAMVLAALPAGFARAEGGYNQPYGYHSCANNNSKACRDAREAFARHHNGRYPEQLNPEWYQGQQGRWNQHGNDWQWKGAEGDEWYQGRQGHWYQERDGWQWRGDQGDEYRRGQNGWQWHGERPQHDRERE